MDFEFFAYLWGGVFVDASVFRFKIKKNSSFNFVYVKDANSWGG